MLLPGFQVDGTWNVPTPLNLVRLCLMLMQYWSVPLLSQKQPTAFSANHYILVLAE